MAATPAITAIAAPIDPLNQTRWLAVQCKDHGSDGLFVFAVKTTGVYCRPSCPARLAKRSNVLFYDTAQQAQAAGFRACKRCDPDGSSAKQKQVQSVLHVCRLIDELIDNPGQRLTLAQLAQRVGLSPYHFQRLFKQVTGVTPRAYYQAKQRAQLSQTLDQQRSVTRAIYDAGFNSSSRFYEQANQLLGMSASRYRAAGQGEEIRYAVPACTLGYVLVAATQRGVCRIELGDEPQALIEQLRERFAQARFVEPDQAFQQWVVQVVQAIDQPRTASSLSSLPLDIQGTAFQQQVWKALAAVPVGNTVSYSQLAEQVGRPAAVRAVASACANNTLAIVIPCHRAVRSDGSLAGYRWGLQRKKALLDKEKDSDE